MTERLLASAAACYGFDRETCRFMTGGREGAKQMYTFHFKGKPYVLRFVKGLPGEIDQTRAEMDWLVYLAGKGAGVPYPLKAKNGELALSMEENNETYVISAFSKVEGQLWNKNDPALWNRRIFFNWGRAVGDIHRLTKDYRPASDVEKRGEFPIRSMIGEDIRAYPSVEKIAEGLLNAIEMLPKVINSYGLIHNDLHPGNFVIDGERIHLYDFDGCAYSWYAFDIGNALYLALWFGRSNDEGTDFTNDIIRCFLKGYLSANHLDDFWLSQIPLFMMCCKIALFSLGCDSEYPNNECSGAERQHQLRNIENNILFTGCMVDYSLFQNAHIENGI